MSDRYAILIVQGRSGYDSLGSFNREIARILKTRGLDPVILDTTQSELFTATLNKTLQDYPDRIGAAFTFSGIGMDIGDTSELGNLWQHFRIPFLSYMLDHPCYYMVRHRHPAPAVMRLYPARDFLDFNRDYVKAPYRTMLCPLGAPLYGRQPLPRAPEKNQAPLILFPKSGANPKIIEEPWKYLPRLMQRIIRDSIDHYWGETARSGNVVASVLVAADAAGVEVRNDLSLLAFFVAQLDDYIRRVKADLVFRQLLPLPVRIYGDNLGYLDTDGARAQVLPPVSYDELLGVVAQALAVISMNPNVDDLCHDRVFMALGSGALPVSDINPWWEKHYPALMPYSYDFHDRGVAQAVDKILADPAHAAAAAWEQSQIQCHTRTFETMADEILEFALMHRYFTFNFRPPQPYFFKDGA